MRKDKKLIFDPKSLWKKVVDQTQYALQCGTLHSLPTDYEFVEEGGINFLVRILANLVRKYEAQKQQDQKSQETGKDGNPFLPYEEDLFVTDISKTHLCLLNKYNVVSHHLLIITRAFEEQETWLNLADFTALWACISEIEGLGFYNGGKLAGASQRHKHLQLVPFPLIPEGKKIPIEAAIATAQYNRNIGIIPSFPFSHAIAQLSFPDNYSLIEQSKLILEQYHTLLEAVNLPVTGSQQTGAYNMILVRKWMMLVPRSQESFQTIAVNSLGFAGALLVHNQQQMAFLKENRPLTILKNVALAI